MKHINIDLCNEFLCLLKHWAEQKNEDVSDLKKLGVVELEDLLDNIQGVYKGHEVKCLVTAYLNDLSEEDLKYIFKTNDFSTFYPNELRQVIYL